MPRPNTLWQHFETSKLSFVKECSGTRFDASDWLVWTSAWHWCHVTEQATQLTMAHVAAGQFYLASLLPSYNVRHESKINWKPINLSACGRYTIDCGIPSIQTTQNTCAEVAWCTWSASCLTDLDYCVAFVNQVGVFLEPVFRTLKLLNGLSQTSPTFLFILLPLALVASITTAATFT